MIQRTVVLPEQDLSLFLEIVKRFRWKEEVAPQNNENYLTPDLIAELDKRMDNYLLNPDTAIDNDQIIKLLQQDDE